MRIFFTLAVLGALAYLFIRDFPVNPNGEETSPGHIPALNAMEAFIDEKMRIFDNAGADYRQKIVVLENRVTDLENALKLFNAGDGVSGAEPVAANTRISRAPTSQTPQDEALPVQDEETIDDRARSLRRIAHDMTLRSVNQHGSKH